MFQSCVEQYSITICWQWLNDYGNRHTGPLTLLGSYCVFFDHSTPKAMEPWGRIPLISLCSSKLMMSTGNVITREPWNESLTNWILFNLLTCTVICSTLVSLSMHGEPSAFLFTPSASFLKMLTLEKQTLKRAIPVHAFLSAHLWAARWLVT